ncbi:uncharacterized protein B0T23DRAFT_405360 [Neurospora hispaniola]|uniref:Questionable protein n=1 Tax=Neurospora hispaniola TaxID=588809 RepID=A0AAJ0I5P7_9PEZI|nr:hypothetical protein B0T23DRAFT_405360 [Neurospora hispaniola]
MGVSAILYFTAIFAATLIAGYQSLCTKELSSTVHNWHPGSTSDWGRPLKMGSVHHRVRRDGNREQHGTSPVFVPISGNGTRLFSFIFPFCPLPLPLHCPAKSDFLWTHTHHMVVSVMRQRHLNRDFILDLLRIGQSSERTRKFAGSIPGHCGVCLARLWLASRLLLHNAQRSLSGLPW